MDMPSSQPEQLDREPESASSTATSRSPLSRRTLLRAASGLGLVTATGALSLSSALAGPGGAAMTTTTNAGRSRLLTLASSVGAACTPLTPEAEEGPFYLPDELVRSNIREDQAGVGLDLTFRVMDSDTCEPLENAAVDVWHCNGIGDYSGEGQAAEGLHPTDSNTYLRGIQLTDARGRCRFTTIIPGWYPGRAVHIHTKVHVGGKVSHHEYVGGTVCHTGQVFFAEKLIETISILNPYDEDPAARTRNRDDRVFTQQAGGRSAIVHTKPNDKTDPTKGYIGVMILGVDPSAVH
jgi:protocatechuate 3,4-dioxygenase beta subunit